MEGSEGRVARIRQHVWHHEGESLPWALDYTDAEFLVRQLDLIDEILRTAGLEYPLGARGVQDLVQQREGQRARAEEAEAKLAEATARLRDVPTVRVSTMCPDCGENRQLTLDGFVPHHMAHNGVDGPVCPAGGRA